MNKGEVSEWKWPGRSCLSGKRLSGSGHGRGREYKVWTEAGLGQDMEALNFQVQEFQSHPVDSLCVIFEKRSEEQKIVTVV
jgi:hypothetical protein